MEELYRYDYEKAITITGVIREMVEGSLRDSPVICYDMGAKAIWDEVDTKLSELGVYLEEQI